MKFINKKIPLGVSTIAIFIVASLAYSIGYKLAMDKFNSILSYINEKQQIYHRLSEIDTSIRRDYIGGIDESALVNSICLGYVNGLDNSECKYLTEQEYSKYLNSEFQFSPITSEVLENNIGYIKVSDVTEEFGTSILSIINSLYLEKKVTNFVIDLRNVKNGEIEYVQTLLDYILPDGSVISTLSKDQKSNQIYKTNRKEFSISPFNCCVLVNENTSGTSEILAHLLKDTGKYKLVGTKTAGKVYKNKVLNFQSGGHVLIFPAFTFKINDIPLNKKTDVDVQVDMTDENKSLLAQNNLPHENDNQLQEALKNF